MRTGTLNEHTAIAGCVQSVPRIVPLSPLQQMLCLTGYFLYWYLRKSLVPACRMVREIFPGSLTMPSLHGSEAKLLGGPSFNHLPFIGEAIAKAKSGYSEVKPAPLESLHWNTKSGPAGGYQSIPSAAKNFYTSREKYLIAAKREYTLIQHELTCGSRSSPSKVHLVLVREASALFSVSLLTLEPDNLSESHHCKVLLSTVSILLL